jgi:AcrR family transcriptional regulator
MATRGRPRTFDREKALRAALDVFRERGYEATTLQMLQKAMGGLAPPSFYAAFKSKQDLFFEALKLYAEGFGSRPQRALNAGATARSSVEGLLNEAIETFDARGEPRGCLVLLSGLNCVTPAVQSRLKPMRERLPALIEARIRRGVKEGDVPKRADVKGLVAFYTTIVHGLALRARDEATREELRDTVRGAMSAWATFTEARASK